MAKEPEVPKKATVETKEAPKKKAEPQATQPITPIRAGDKQRARRRGV